MHACFSKIMFSQFLNDTFAMWLPPGLESNFTVVYLSVHLKAECDERLEKILGRQKDHVFNDKIVTLFSLWLTKIAQTITLCCVNYFDSLVD